MNAQVLALQAAVEQNSEVVTSATTLLSGLSTQLTAALVADAQANGLDTADLAAITGVLTAVQANSAALAAAVAANTPAASAPPPTPAAVDAATVAGAATAAPEASAG